MSDQPMVCESPLRFRLNLAHVQIMPKGAIKVLRNADGGRGVSDFLEKSVTKV